ncbi:TetR/AcrR family transcriptional regulator [Verrucomicrobia bacterium]|nr:TetR/AcrR family transcriptional regulator [Verrucomicrobiota bacterium]MDB4459031.1 TetR/AcrR family transcriptional regulator [bacterium]
MKITGTAMATPEGQARNEEVFRTAAGMLVKKGYGGTSMSDIAKAVGMTKAGLYHHISSKQDMVFQILQHALDGLDSFVIEPTKGLKDPEERLREIISLNVRGIIHFGPQFTLLLPERHHLDPAQQIVISGRINSYRSFVSETLQQMASQGKLRDLDINIATRHIMQTIVGIARWFTEFPIDDEDHLVEQTVDYSLSAILKR